MLSASPVIYVGKNKECLSAIETCSIQNNRVLSLQFPCPFYELKSILYSNFLFIRTGFHNLRHAIIYYVQLTLPCRPEQRRKIVDICIVIFANTY